MMIRVPIRNQLSPNLPRCTYRSMVLRSTRNLAAKSSIEKYSCDDCCWVQDDSCSATLCRAISGDSYVLYMRWSTYSVDLQRPFRLHPLCHHKRDTLFRLKGRLA